MTFVTSSLFQALLGEDVWFGRTASPAATFDPAFLSSLPVEWTDMVGEVTLRGSAAWQADGNWWGQPVVADATIVRVNVYPAGAPGVLPGPPRWWRTI